MSAEPSGSFVLLWTRMTELRAILIFRLLLEHRVLHNVLPVSDCDSKQDAVFAKGTKEKVAACDDGAVRRAAGEGPPPELALVGIVMQR